jgi:hypothetical protein
VRFVRTLLLTVIVAAVAATGAGAAGHPTALPNCLGKATVRPTSIILACADANFGIKHLSWIGWGGTRAAATGTAYANDCTPDCAAGHFHSYGAVIVVDGAQSCGGKVEYRRLTIAFAGPTPYPKAKPADLVYSLRCSS